MQMYNDFFGSYGGRFVAEMLRAPLDDLQEAFIAAAADASFTRELSDTLRDFAGRPTPLMKAENATRELGGASLYIKLEGLAHTAAVATPCWPAPVSAIMRVFPIRLASSACPTALLIL